MNSDFKFKLPESKRVPILTIDTLLSSYYITYPSNFFLMASPIYKNENSKLYFHFLSILSKLPTSNKFTVSNLPL